jgi:hypothetical protein
MHRTRVAEAATLTAALVPVVAAVVAAVIVAGWVGVAVLTGAALDEPTTALLVEGGNRGW